MNGIHRLSALSALAAFLILPSQAQTEAPEPVGETEVVVVTADRTVQPISQSIATATVITAKQIKEQGAQTVADVMRLVPGVTLRQTGQVGAAASAYIRGSKTNQILVLLDGVRVSSPAITSGVDLSKFPVSDVARIEVVRGPASSLYGSEAIGGVINIITQKPEGTSGSANCSTGSNGRSTPSLSLRGGGSNAPWQLVSSIQEYSGERSNSDYSATGLSASIGLPSADGWESALRIGQYRDSLGLPGPDYSHTGQFDPDDRQWYDRDNVDLYAKRDLGSEQLEWRAYRVRQRLHYIDPGYSFEMLTTGTTDGTEAVLHIERGTHQFILGGEYRHDRYRNIMSFSATSDESISNLALFVQDRWTLSEKADLVFGARLDDHSTAGSKVTPRVGMSYAPAPGNRLRISYAEGFRAPNFVELYYAGYGNPLLEPEKSRQYEIGLNMEVGKSTYDLAIFDSAARDMINTQVKPYENTSRAGQRGIELSWAHRLSRSSDLSLSYAYVDARDRTNNKRLIGIPHNQLSVTLAGVVESYQIGVTGRWTDDRPDQRWDAFPATNVTVPGRTIFDLTLNKRGTGRTNPYAIIRNLFNVVYEEVAGYPAEGRSIEVGMRSAW